MWGVRTKGFEPLDFCDLLEPNTPSARCTHAMIAVAIRHISKGGSMKPSLPVLAMCLLCLNGCSGGVNLDSEAAPEPEQTSPSPAESFTPRELTVADMPDPSRVLWKLASWRNQPTERLTTLRPYATFCHSLAKNEDSCLCPSILRS